MARNYRDSLRLIRPYTGRAFTKVNGYSASKKPSFGQRMAVLKYARKVEELLTRPAEILTPKRGEKAEIFRETRQNGFRYFTKAIIPKPPTPVVVHYTLDKTRPRGSQLVATDKKTKQRYYHIPAEVFLESDEIDTEFYKDIIQQYAEDAQFFLIQAGESYMWGSATGRGGTLDGVAQKIKQILENYSALMFDANDKNSSYYGKWFRGITAFTSVHDALPELGKQLRRQAEYRERFRVGPQKYRETRDGQTRRFENGELAQGWIRIKPPPGAKPAAKGQNFWGYFVDGLIVERQWR